VERGGGRHLPTTRPDRSPSVRGPPRLLPRRSPTPPSETQRPQRTRTHQKVWTPHDRANAPRRPAPGLSAGGGRNPSSGAPHRRRTGARPVGERPGDQPGPSPADPPTLGRGQSPTLPPVPDGPASPGGPEGPSKPPEGGGGGGPRRCGGGGPRRCGGGGPRRCRECRPRGPRALPRLRGEPPRHDPSAGQSQA